MISHESHNQFLRAASMANALLLSGSSHFTKHPALPSLQWRNDPFSHPPSFNLRFTPFPSTCSLKPIKFSPKCSAKSPVNPKSKMDIQVKDPNPIGVVVHTFLNALKALRKPAIALVLIGLLLLSDPISAWAASGGRMGGRAFTSSAPSRSYSAGRASSAFSYTTPYYSPTPFGGGGFYVGPAFWFGNGSSFLYVLMGLAVFILLSGFLSDRSEDSVMAATEKTSVLKLQVGLLGNARSLQRDLDRIAQTADTSTPEGLSYVLTEATLALLRHPDYCISAYSSADVSRSIEKAEKQFNQLSIEERGKFDEETLVNVNNVRRQRTTSLRASGFSNEYIVITILVAAEGAHKLPTINGSKDLQVALQKLGTIPCNRTMAVEVLWTPQDENDALSERELLKDYPLLRPL